MPLKVTTYHGAGRGKIDFGAYDVIVTSYGLWEAFDEPGYNQHH